MRGKWRQAPDLVVLWGAIAAVAGSVAGLLICAQLTHWAMAVLGTGWGSSISGVSGVGLLGQMVAQSAVVGGLTGCAWAHSRGKYRQLAGWVLLCCSSAAALLLVQSGLGFADTYGRRLALAVFGIPVLWSSLLMPWATFMAVVPKAE